MGNQYTEDYYMRGKEKGLSLYENYRWLPDLTVPMANSIISHCGIKRWMECLDFGCARGYTVRAFNELGYRMEGVDCSEWAVQNCDQKVKELIKIGTRSETNYSWIIAKDVLEHVEPVAECVDNLMNCAVEGVFAVVPLSHEDGRPYVAPDYERDVTHIHRLTLASWAKFFTRPGWTVELSYRVGGIKDNWAQYLFGNGFITARRMRR